MLRNCDLEVAAGFGEQWVRFDHSSVDTEELRALFHAYFKLFPWDQTLPDAEGVDVGCGPGRWTQFVAPRVGTLHCVEPATKALEVARRTLAPHRNCVFHLASLDEMPMPDNSLDFGYAIGVLHYVPDPASGLKSCVAKLKRGAPFLVYVYYALENRPAWYRVLWCVVDRVRRITSRLPGCLAYALSQTIALSVYYPLARLALFCERVGCGVEPAFPFLSTYS